MATQTRISESTHERLTRIAQQTGQTHQEVIDAALTRYERELFLDEVNVGYAALRADPDAWRELQEERATWDDTLWDGLIGPA
ncbi:MAG: toxin-antitoxin system protein [Gemmatimonadota bacterium]